MPAGPARITRHDFISRQGRSAMLYEGDFIHDAYL